MLVTNQSVQSTRSRNDDVRMLILIFQDSNVVLHRSATVKNGSTDIGHVLAETCILVLDLVSQLTSVTHDQYRYLARNRVDLLESCEDKDGSLTETRLGLAENIGSED